MDFFIDTANIEEIRRGNDWGMLGGVIVILFGTATSG